MSLNRFKEALKPCSASSSAASATNTSLTSPFSATNPSSLTQSPPPARKPPKSSLSQQLQRLDLPESAKRPPRRLADKIKEQEEEQRERVERRPIPPAAPPVREPFSADPRGPFEPLLVSAPGEIPVVQVPASINCRLLEHQRHGVRFMYSLYKNDHGGVLGDDMMLDILEKFLIRKRYCFSRLDGSTPMNLRQSLVDEFNRSPSQQVFLISTRAGGLGLNLVSANRVVIFDPNWNPAQDLQAQDRSFRYGQKRHVIVFRLLAAGSLEELVYSRQVYKQQLSNIAVSGKMERRYFHGVQDCKEFKGELFGISNLFRDLSDKLFTNEIFKSHMNQGQEYNDLHVRGRVGENGMDPATQTMLSSDVAQANVVSCSRKSDIVSAKETESHLGDLGIVYSHRNEDVLNIGLQWKEEGSGHEIDSFLKYGHEIDSSKKNVDRADKGLKINDLFKAARKPPSKEEKREAFRRVAKYMGMGELELSKWIISVSPSERNEMLQNYKKKRKKKFTDDG